jgi:hypothetical protein
MSMKNIYLFLILLLPNIVISQNFSLVPVGNVITCDTNVFHLIISNNQNSNLTVNNLTLEVNPNASITSSNFPYTTSSNQITFTVNETILPNESDTIEYSIFFSCEMIQLTTNNQGNYVPYFINDTITYNNSVTILSPYNVGYPFLVVSALQGNNLHFTHVGETTTRTFSYANAGNTAFSGSITFNDIMDCFPVNINKIRLLVNGVAIDSVLSSSLFSLNFNSLNISIPPNQTFTIEEELFNFSCLADSCGTNSGSGAVVNSNIQLNWGCNLNLCKNTPSFASIQRDTNRPKINLFRIDPQGISPWDSICFNLPSNIPFYDSTNLKWQTYLLINTGDAIAFNVQPRLNANITNGFFTTDMLFLENIFFSHDDSLIQVGYGNTTFQNNSCYETAIANNLTPISSITWHIDSLFPGDTMTLSFGTYRCCPNDSTFFNIPKYFNTWAIEGNSGSGGAFIAQDECGANLSILSDQDDLANGLFKPNELRPKTIQVSQTLIEPISNLTGTPNSCDTGATTIFYVETTDFNIFYGNNSQLHQLFASNINQSIEGLLKVSIKTEVGLVVDSSTFSQIKIRKIGLTDWLPISVTQVQSFGGSGGIYEIIFDIQSFQNFDSLKTFITGSYLHFPLTPCCPFIETPVNYSLSWHLQSLAFDCDTCWMALSQQVGDVNVQCPGCITPGIIVKNVSFERMNFGYADADNNGRADFPLNPLNAPPHIFSKRLSTPGDTMYLWVTSNAVDGNATTGVTLQQWNNYWNPLGDTMQYLYIEIASSGDEFGNFSYQMNNDTLHFKSAQTNTTYLIPISIYRNFLDQNRFFYNINIQDLKANSWVPNNLEFNPGDQYNVEADFYICGNDFSAPEESIFDVGVRIFWSGNANLTSFENTLDAGEFFVDSLGAASLLPDYGYNCETDATPTTLYRYYLSVSSSWRNYEGDTNPNDVSCNKASRSDYSVKLGTTQFRKNFFPYEVKILPLVFNEYENSVPNGYILESINLISQVPPINNGSTFNNSQNVSLNPPSNTYSILANTYTNHIWNESTLQNNLNGIVLADEIQRLIVVSSFKPDTLCNLDTVRMFDSLALFTLENKICGNQLEIHYENTNQNTLIKSPKPTLSLSYLSSNYILEDDSACYYFNIVNDSLNYDVDFPFVYLQELPFTTISGIASTINNPNIFNNNQLNAWGGLNLTGFNQNRIIRFCLQTDTCLLDSFPSIEIPVMFGWDCSSYPSSLTDTACNVYFDTLVIHKVPVVFTSDTLMQPDCFALCDTVSLMAQASSLAQGNINELWFQINMPSSSQLLATRVTFPNDTVTALTPSPIDTQTINNEIVYTYSLGGYPWTIEDTSDILSVQFDISYLPGCEVLVSEVPSILMGGIAYCGDSIATLLMQFEEMFICGDSCIPLSVNATITQPYCEGSNDGSIQTTTSGAGPFVYAWTGPDGFSSNAANINNVAPGVYTLIIQDAQLCFDTLIYTLTPQQQFSIAASINPETCSQAFSGSIQLQTSGFTPPVSISWTGPNGFTAFTNNIANIATGTYNLSIQDSFLCNLDTTFYVPFDSTASFAQITETPDSCTGTISLLASSGNSWLWNTGDTTQSIVVNQVGYYEVNVTQNTCLSTANTTITSLPLSPLYPINIVIGNNQYSQTLLSDVIALYPQLAGGINNETILVNGELLFDLPNYDISYSQIYFSSGAGITLNDANISNANGNYNFKNSVFDVMTGACDTMWRGIIVSNDMHLSIYDSEINNAMYGVQVLHKSLFEADNIQFKNNFIGIFMPPVYYNSNATSSIHLFKVNNCNFFGEFPGLLYPYVGQVNYYTNLLYYGSGAATSARPSLGKKPYAGVYALNNVFYAINNSAFSNLSFGVKNYTTQTFFQKVQLWANNYYNITNEVVNNMNPYGSIMNPLIDRNGYCVYSYSQPDHNLTNVAVGMSNFYDSKTGVYGKSANLGIRSNNMFNVESGVQQTQGNMNTTNIDNNVIQNSIFGISIQNTEPRASIYIQNNRITTKNSASSIGVRVIETSSNVDTTALKIIKDNEINLGQAKGGIFLQNARFYTISNPNFFGINMFAQNSVIQTSAKVNYAIRINGGSNNAVAKVPIIFNTILPSSNYATGSINAVNEPVGIDVVSSPDCIIECNELNKVYTGIRIDGNSNGLKIRGNTFGSMYGGLRYNQSFSTNGSVIQSNSGNRWIGPFINFMPTINASAPGNFKGGAALNVNYWFNQQSPNSPLILQDQVYTIATQNPPLFPQPTDIYPQIIGFAEWFVQSGNIDFDCSTSSYFLSQPNPSNIALMELTAEGKLAFEEYEKEINQQQQIALFNKIKEETTIIGLSSKVDSFYTENLYGVMQQMYEANESNKSIENVDKQALEQLMLDIDMLMRNIEVLDSIHLNDTILSTAYLQEKESLLQNLETKNEELKSIKENIEIEEELLKDETILKYNGIIDNELIQKNERIVNGLWLSTLAKNIEPTSNEFALLSSIANQCPIAGGNAVYAARSFVQHSSIDSIMFWDDYSLCLLDGFDTRKTDGEEIKEILNPLVLVYPNPSDDLIKVNYQNHVYDCINVIVSNLSGQEVNSVIYCKKGSLDMDLSSLSAGTYFIQIFEKMKLIHQEKIIIK